MKNKEFSDNEPDPAFLGFTLGMLGALIGLELSILQPVQGLIIGFVFLVVLGSIVWLAMRVSDALWSLGILMGCLNLIVGYWTMKYIPRFPLCNRYDVLMTILIGVGLVMLSVLYGAWLCQKCQEDINQQEWDRRIL